MSPLLPTALAALLPLEELDGVPTASDMRPGWGLFLVVVGLILVSVLLWRNMRKQLGKIDFEESSDAGRPERQEPPTR